MTKLAERHLQQAEAWAWAAYTRDEAVRAAIVSPETYWYEVFPEEDGRLLYAVSHDLRFEANGVYIRYLMTDRAGAYYWVSESLSWSEYTIHWNGASYALTTDPYGLYWSNQCNEEYLRGRISHYGATGAREDAKLTEIQVIGEALSPDLAKLFLIAVWELENGEILRQPGIVTAEYWLGGMEIVDYWQAESAADYDVAIGQGFPQEALQMFTLDL